MAKCRGYVRLVVAGLAAENVTVTPIPAGISAQPPGYDRAWSETS